MLPGGVRSRLHGQGRPGERLLVSGAMANLSIPVSELTSFDLPPVCLVTGGHQGVSFRPVKFSWYPRWIPALILVPFGGLLLAAIVALVMTKKAKGELPFSDAGWSRWRTAKLLAGLSILWLFVAIFAGLFFAVQESSAPALALFASALIVPIGANLGLRRRMIQVKKITDAELTIDVPSEAAAREVEARLHGGGVRAA